MRRSTSVFSSMALALSLAVLAACGPSQEEQLAAAQAETLSGLEAAKAELEARRQELKDVRAELAAAVEESGEEAADRIAEMEAKVKTLADGVAAQSDEFSSAVVDFINSDPPIEGEPLTENQAAAIRMKSAEDILVAREHIEKGGDYRRAIDIYNSALQVDPDNPDLQAALARAEEMRYLSQERFAEVKKDMTEAEVKKLLGQPNLRNIREYPDRGVRAWFYPTDEEGNAAAVWFRKKGDRQVVYQLDYSAIDKDSEEGEGP